MNPVKKRRVLGIGREIRTKALRGGKRKLIWHEVIHSERKGLKQLVYLAEDKEHFLHGKMHFVDKIHRVSRLWFDELPMGIPWKTSIVIRHVRVKGTHRGEQITPEMIKYVLETAKKMQRVRTVELTCELGNERALGIYNKMGFCEYERHPASSPAKKGEMILSMRVKIRR